MKKRCIAAFTAIAIMFCMLGFNANAAATVNVTDIATTMNALRAECGVGALAWDADLASAATIRAAECAQSFSHVRPDGTAFYTVSSVTMGETISRPNADQTAAIYTIAAWYRSSAHRALMLDKNFTRFGIAAYTAPDGYTYVVCEYA